MGGVAVAGPPLAPLAPLIQPITGGEIAGAARDVLLGQWKDFADHPPAVAVTRVYQVFVIETMLRALATIQTQEPPTKRAAAWVAACLPPEWRPLLAQAIAWRAQFTHERDMTPEPETLPATLRFIRYSVAQAETATL